MLLTIYCLLLLLEISTQHDILFPQFRGLRNSNVKYSSKVVKIAKSITPEIITSYGYPAETHYVTTEDGYILTMHRMKREGGRPFYLQHGLIDSSVTYVLMGPKIGLGYTLWDLGYDVWLGNVRGNRYSRNHTTLSPDNEKFWQFSWHEIGIYDLPAMIDYVLNTTNFSQLYYAGHSQGTTAFWVMCSRKSRYNEKIILMQALAPVAFMSHIKCEYLKMFGSFTEPLLRMIGPYEALPQRMFSRLCNADENVQSVMKNVFMEISGPNRKDFNESMWYAICNHLPAGAATKQIIHFHQLIESGRFCEYDYGPQRNMLKYGALIPPKYNLKKVRAPVALYYGENDYLTSPEDVEYLATQLGNVVEKYLVPLPEFNHLDFIWSAKAPKLLYTKFLEVLGKFPPEGQ